METTQANAARTPEADVDGNEQHKMLEDEVSLNHHHHSTPLVVNEA